MKPDLMKAKQSMSVHPAPIVVENGRLRHPKDGERRYANGFASDLWEPWPGEWGYRITRVTNSVDYRPGFLLNKPQVQSLIDQGWTVTVLSK
jgi:hypothetical protein